MRGSVFRDLEQAGHFFRGGECGYSPGLVAGTRAWRRWLLFAAGGIAADAGAGDARVHVSGVQSCLARAVKLDSAFVMRVIEHTWSACGEERFGVVGGGAEERMRAA